MAHPLLGGSLSSRKCDKSYYISTPGPRTVGPLILKPAHWHHLTFHNMMWFSAYAKAVDIVDISRLIAPHAGGHTWKKTPCLGTAKATFDDAGGVAHLCPSTTFAHRKNAIRLDWIRLVQSQGTTDGSNGAPKIHPSIKDFPLKCRENLDRSRKLETKNGYRWKRGLINKIWRV